MPQSKPLTVYILSIHMPWTGRPDDLSPSISYHIITQPSSFPTPPFSFFAFYIAYGILHRVLFWRDQFYVVLLFTKFLISSALPFAHSMMIDALSVPSILPALPSLGPL